MKKTQLDKDILISALSERYKSIHIIRERVQSISVWVLGLLLGAAAWIYQSDMYFNKPEFLIIAIIIVLVWFSLWKFYLDDLKKGFNSQRRVAAKIEKNLGFYENGENSVYPQAWKDSGKEGCEGNFMCNTYYLIALGFLLLLISISSHTHFC
jgi:hypothetical protein